MPKIKHLLDKLDNAARRLAYHGSPHDFAAERLVRLADGTEQWIVGKPGLLPDVPAGAEVLKDAPLGRFRLDKMGTGEGAQAYGAGAYLSSSDSIARGYRNKLSDNNFSFADEESRKLYDDVTNFADGAGLYALRIVNGKGSRYEKAADLRRLAEDSAALNDEYYARAYTAMADLVENGKMETRTTGKLYTAEIPHESLMLDWDKPLSEQPEYVRQSFAAVVDVPKSKRLQSRGDWAARTDEFGNEWWESKDIDGRRGVVIGKKGPTRFRPGQPVSYYVASSSNKGFGEFSTFEEAKAAAEGGVIADDFNPLDREIASIQRSMGGEMTGRDVYEGMAKKYGWSQDRTSQELAKRGIPGLTYIGGTSGERNFVLFDESAIDIKEKGMIDPRLLVPVAAAGGVGVAAQAYDYGTPELDAAYRAYESKRSQKRDIWRTLKDSIEFGATLGSAIGGGIIADASRLGGYLNPFMSTQDTEQGAQVIENNLQYVPSQPNAMLESFGQQMNQFSQDIEPLAAPFRQSIPYKAYEALPERAQGIVRIGADYAF
jgi:hypothetical protein